MASPAKVVKLTYFDLTGLGEPIRFLLAYGGYDFEDERVTREDFALRKQSFPFGQVPVLEIDGKVLHQSVAICRYLARKVGLTGRSEDDVVFADIMVDTINDFRLALGSFHYEQHEEAQAQKREVVMTVTVPFYLSKFEEQLARNGGHFIDSQLTWPDIFFTSMFEYFNFVAGRDLFADRPTLQALRDKVLALPRLQKYLANRPETSC